MQTNFPDTEYIKKLVQAQAKKVSAESTSLELLQMYSGARLNWLADFFTDTNIAWSKRILPIDDLTFTGTSPAWNKILIDKCKRSPKKFRNLISKDKSFIAGFAEAIYTNDPILVRLEKDKLKVLDGTHRLVGAIIAGKQKIMAYVAKPAGKPKPDCEPHVIYDLIRAYQRGLNRDRAGLVAALKFLNRAFGNVDGLLRGRFNFKWIPDKDIQAVIAEALSE